MSEIKTCTLHNKGYIGAECPLCLKEKETPVLLVCNKHGVNFLSIHSCPRCAIDKCGRERPPNHNDLPTELELFVEKLNHNFKYHTPKEGQLEKYTEIRETAKQFATLIAEFCPSSRERSVAITKLEEVVMWANASIARKG